MALALLGALLLGCQGTGGGGGPAAGPAGPGAGSGGHNALVLVAEGRRSVGWYLRDPLTGALVDRGERHLTAQSPPTALAQSGGRYVYIATRGGHVHAYRWRARRATLVRLSAPVTSGGSGITSLAVSGAVLYALNTSNDTLTRYRIASDGTLDAPASFAPRATLQALASGPGGLVYGLTGDAIHSYGVVNGRFTALAKTPVPRLIAATSGASGTLYALTAGHVRAFSAQADGALTPSQSQALPAGMTPQAIAAGPRLLAVTGQGSDGSELATFPVAAGALGAPAAPVATHGPAGALSVSASGGSVFVTDTTGDDLLAYRAPSAGRNVALQALARTRLSPGAMISLPVSVVIEPQRLYVVDQSTGTINQYAIGANGALTGPLARVAVGTGPSALALAPDGSRLYVTSWAQAGPGTVSAIPISASGAMSTPGAPAQAGEASMGVAADPSGRYLYVANSCYQNGAAGNCAGSVDGYAVGSHATLTPFGSNPVSTGGDNYPMLLTVDPTGRFLYVSEFDTGAVGVFAINGASGALTTESTAPGAAAGGAWTVIAGPSGRHLYVSDDNAQGGVSVYAIDAATGALTLTQTLATTAGDTIGLAIGPLGRRLYVASESGDLDVFQRPQPLASDARFQHQTTIAGFPDAYGLAIAGNDQALYVVIDGCLGSSPRPGAVDALTIPPFASGLTAADYPPLGGLSTTTGSCGGLVEATAGGGLG